MGRFLVLTSDLPYFPGRNGHDYFNLSELAKYHDVALVGPFYDWFPPEGVRNLEAFLTGSYFWPREADVGSLFASGEALGETARWSRFLPPVVCRFLTRRMLELHKKPADAYEKLSILANCAPNLIEALRSKPWQAIIVIQSSLEPWLDFLPSTPGKAVYFHDVRSDYFRNESPLPGRKPRSRRELASVKKQEASVASSAELIGFVSNLDEQRALSLLNPKAETAVAPIPIDMEYFHPRPPQLKPRSNCILFTGHLSHPPNVDAVLFFLRSIWPHVLQAVPDATFVVAGMLPSDELKHALNQATRCELYSDVPDIRPLFWDAAVYVVPMRFGGGVRQKIFEAWSIRIPVICTTMGAEGTGAINGKHCLLEDDPLSFAHRIVSVLRAGEDPELVTAANELVRREYSLHVATPKFRRFSERTVELKQKKTYKLLYDLRWMELGKAGGMEQAVYELIGAISQVDHRNEYKIFSPRSSYHEWNFPESFQVESIYSDYNGRRTEAQRSFFTNQFAQRGGLTPILNRCMRTLRELRRMDCDLVHATCGYFHPDLDSLPGILTVHDLQHVHQPNFFSSEAWHERDLLYRTSIKKAHHIICISEFTRQDLHRSYGVPLDKMTTVWNIPDRNAWRLLSTNVRRSYLLKMGIEGAYFFYPAQNWPHKNHAALLDGFELAIQNLPMGVKLVLAGRPFPLDHAITERLRSEKLKGRVVHLGFRTPVEIRALFQGAMALVFPSLFEGFGIPLAEAMFTGTPIACSNVCSMPEIAREAALYFDPTNVVSIANVLVRIAKDSSVREELRQAGLKLSHTFSARDSAIKTLSLYRQVYEDLYKI